MRQPLSPFSSNAMTVLCKRYLRPIVSTNSILNPAHGRQPCKHCGKHHETPEEMFDRCSFGSDDFYNLLGSRDFLPNSPTLFNAGTGQGTYSGCFKFDVEDTMDSILDVARKAALVLKWGGGAGFYLGNLRRKDAMIKTTHGKACGPVAVLEYYHAGAQLITQSGKRQAAQMGILPCDHPDIEEFIHCKDGGKNLSTFNISVSCTDEFMRDAVTVGTRAYDIFKQMVESAWKTGDPGIYFVDTSERANPTPWLGKLTATNPCGEVPLLDNEPCNLGSINLGHTVVDGVVDWDKLKRIVVMSVRYLDTVLDNNTFPLPEIAEAASRTRKLGLGVMGWADMLSLLRVHYDSVEAVDLAEKLMLCVQVNAHHASALLAEEKGACPAFGSIEGKNRNATVTCIAPAGSICTLADCSSGIEPYYTLKGVRVMGDGTQLTEAVRVDIGKFVPHTALQIAAEWHVKHQAAFQANTDLAVSKTVNMPNSVTREQVREAFLLAWKMGCKGITVYRDGSRNVQVISQAKGDNVGIVPLDTYNTDIKFGMQRHKMAIDADAKRHKFCVGSFEGYLHIGLLPDGTPGELFITSANQGSTVSGLLASVSIITSLALQYGVPLETMVDKLRHIRFEPAGITGNKDIPTASSIVAYIYRYLGHRFLEGSKALPVQTGMICPECGALAIAEEGCLSCSQSCGWSRC